MNKIEKLIAKLCPNGVEFKALHTITHVGRGKRLTKRELDSTGRGFPVYSGGVTPMGYYGEYNQPANTVTVVKYGTAGFVNYISQKFWANDVCYCIKPRDETYLQNKFLYYTLKNRQLQIQSLVIDAIPAHLPTDSIKNFLIPIPPLEIQQEIVNILDTFSELKVELNAELEARRKQYQYYRDELLNFSGALSSIHNQIGLTSSDKVPIKELGEIGKLVRGNGIQKSDFTEHGTGCIHYGQIHTHYGVHASKTKSFIDPSLATHLRKAQKGDLVIATTSEDDSGVAKAVAWIGDENIAVSTDAYILSHSLNPKYLSYFFQTEIFHKQKQCHITGTKVRRISGKRLAKIKIPVPPLEVQNGIVSILDNFDALVNDLLIGIPAEIIARRKQYEYYREKLLTFKEAP